jgi:hypothetical protein
MKENEVSLLKDLINANFTSVRASLEEKHDMQMLKMDDIDLKVNKINGRVSKLEETTTTLVNDMTNLNDKTNKLEEKQRRYAIETKLIRFLSTRPKLIILILLGIFTIINSKSIYELIKLIF